MEVKRYRAIGGMRYGMQLKIGNGGKVDQENKNLQNAF